MLANTKVVLMPDGGIGVSRRGHRPDPGDATLALLVEQLPAREALAWGLISAVYPDMTSRPRWTR